MEIESTRGTASAYAPPLDHCSELQFPNSAYLVWEDLTVILPNYGKGPTRRLIQGLSGYCEPGRIMAIMGPSGSGKSTLLDSLAGNFLSMDFYPFFFLFNFFLHQFNWMRGKES